MLACQRHQFSLPADGHYLNCAYMGPLPKVTEAAGVEALRKKSNPTRIVGQHDFFEPVEELRELAARLVHTSPERVAFIPSASYGIALATSNLRLRPGQNVVIPDEEFPSDVYGWMHRCQVDGAELRLVPRPTDSPTPGAAWNQRVLEAIDANTAVVTLTAVHWTDGTWFDVEAIGRRARDVGALYVVDGTQSVGAFPFDMTRVQPDLLVTAAYKWLLGPYTFGFAVLGDRLLSGDPVEMTWIGRENSQDFANLVHYRDGFRHGARRFDFGEHSNGIMVDMLTASLRLILEWGVDNIQAYCAALAERLGERLAETGFRVAPAAERTGHMFGVYMPDGLEPARAMEVLREKGIHVSVRGQSVRVAPHVYNDEADVAALADALLTARG